jgi:hypothetical protein
MGAGSTTFISFDEPAVLTTLPATWTGACVVLGVDGAVDPDPEQPASQQVRTVSIAIAIFRLFDGFIKKTVVITRIRVGFRRSDK